MDIRGSAPPPGTLSLDSVLERQCTIMIFGPKAYRARGTFVTHFIITSVTSDPEEVGSGCKVA